MYGSRLPHARTHTHPSLSNLPLIPHALTHTYSSCQMHSHIRQAGQNEIRRERERESTLNQLRRTCAFLAAFGVVSSPNLSHPAVRSVLDGQNVQETEACALCPSPAGELKDEPPP